MEYAGKQQNNNKSSSQKTQSFFRQKKEPAFFSPLHIQPTLTIGPVDDIYEREADAVADNVMRMRDADVLQQKSLPADIQRKCAACEEKRVQMKGESKSGSERTAPSSVNNVTNSQGQKLDSGVRQFMESRFGCDFGNVQVHDDSLAHRSSADINALAYTHGSHIVFGDGQYQPNTTAGQKLLAHELTHFLQQNSNNIIRRQPSKASTTQPSTNVIISLDNDSETKIQSAVKIKGAKQIRAFSVADLASQLAKLNGKVDNIIIYSHGAGIGSLKFVDSRGKESWVDIEDITKAISGKINISVNNLEFEGCSLGNASSQLSAFKTAIKATSVKAHSCFTFTRILKSIRINGRTIKKKSDLKTGEEPLFRKTLLAEAQKTLVAANGTAVTDCVEGITPYMPLNISELESVFFANNGVIIAEWDSPVYNKNWQPGSLCKKDVTATTTPCKLIIAP